MLKQPYSVKHGGSEGIIHTHRDERGIAWIDDTNVKVSEIVLDKRGRYATAEAIQAAPPGLSLAQIHAALAYYYDHQDDLEAQLAQDERDVQALRGFAAALPTRPELEARLRSRELAKVS